MVAPKELSVLWMHQKLTHYGLVIPYNDVDLINNIGSGDGSKPLHEPRSAASHYMNQGRLIFSEFL